MVKPVLLYASEIAGTLSKNINCSDDSNIDLANLAVYGELGRYPLYIDTLISMLKLWVVRLCKKEH